MNVEKVWQMRGRAGTEQTLMRMRDQILASDASRAVKAKAREVTAHLQPNDELGQIGAVYAWIKDNVRYVRDTYGVEELTRPDRIVLNLEAREETHSSDCDDMAMLGSAMLRSLGFQTRVEALAVNQDRGYDHARVAVFSRTLDRWLPLELTKPGAPVGFGLPSKLPILAVEVY